MTETNKREQLVKLFSGFEDSVLISFAEGRVGRGWVDDENDMKSGIINAGDFYFTAGEPVLAKEAAELAKDNSEAVFMPSSAEWVDALLGLKIGLKCQTRYRTSPPERFDVKKLETLSDMSGLDGFTLGEIDEDIYEQSLKEMWSRSFVCNFLDYKDFVKNGFGKCITYEGKLVCAASCYSSYSRGVEVEIATHPVQRRKGLALRAGAAFVLECSRRGLAAHWDAGNGISLKIARKLGYTLKEEYTSLVFE